MADPTNTDEIITLETNYIDSVVCDDEGNSASQPPDMNEQTTSTKTSDKNPSGFIAQNLPSWNTFKTLTLFLVFKVIVPFVDVFTDSLTAWGHWSRGHLQWSLVTILLMFCPFLAGVIKCLRLAMWNLHNAKDMQNLKFYIQGATFLLPIVQTIVSFTNWLKLLKIDLEDTANNEVIEKIKDKTVSLNFYEAYFEAGPQFIFQLNIVLRIGYITGFQLVSIPISCLSLSLAATKAYFQQRLLGFSDPDPPLNAHFIVSSCLFLFLTFGFVTTWSIIVAYLKWMAFVSILLAVALNIVACIPVYYYNISWSQSLSKEIPLNMFVDFSGMM